MCLFKENMKLTGQLKLLEYDCSLTPLTNFTCSYRKAYVMLVSAPGVVAQVTAEVIQDTTPKNPDNYPEITYWHKHVQLDEKNRQLKFTKASPGCKSKHKNVAFWHFQHWDGTMLDYEEVKSICKTPRRSGGSFVTSMGQSAHLGPQFPPSNNWSFTSRLRPPHPAKKAQGSSNLSSEYSSSDDLSSKEDCSVKGNNVQSVEDPEADPLPCQLPFTTPRTSL
jgi:hypothetical protein